MNANKRMVIIGICSILIGIAFALLVEPIDYREIPVTVVYTYYNSNHLKFRISVTNNYIWEIDPANGTYMKIDFIYGAGRGIPDVERKNGF